MYRIMIESLHADVAEYLNELLGEWEWKGREDRKRWNDEYEKLVRVIAEFDSVKSVSGDDDGGKLALVRVWSEDECEEIAPGEYQPKPQAADWLKSREDER